MNDLIGQYSLQDANELECNIHHATQRTTNGYLDLLLWTGGRIHAETYGFTIDLKGKETQSGQTIP